MVRRFQTGKIDVFIGGIRLLRLHIEEGEGGPSKCERVRPENWEEGRGSYKWKRSTITFF